MPEAVTTLAITAYGPLSTALSCFAFVNFARWDTNDANVDVHTIRSIADTQVLYYLPEYSLHHLFCVTLLPEKFHSIHRHSQKHG